MIRTFQEEDIDRIAEIWLDTNVKAHNFIPAQYWKGHFNAVKKMLLQAELYVYEDEQGIQGFVGLNGDYIAGIFVWEGNQSRGIGRQLLDFVKAGRTRLCLNVFQKNSRAVKFYQTERFLICGAQIDEDTGEAEYTMEWKR